MADAGRESLGDALRAGDPDATPAPGPGPGTSSELREAGARLMQRLSPQERAALLLRESFDMGLEEIAER